MNSGSAPPRILLADNDPDSRGQFCDFFQLRGWEFDVARQGVDLIGAMSQRDYDLVIADVAMPGTDALTILAEIVKQKPGQAIIAVSAKPSFDEALRYFRNGATDLTARPVDLGWLERSVKQVVHARRVDEKERKLYEFVRQENSTVDISSAELAELGTITLPLISRIADARVLDKNDCLRIRLAVQEAIVNALEHGNLELRSEWKDEIGDDGFDRFSIERKARLMDPAYCERRIRINASYNAVTLSITIADEGKGFLNEPFGNGKRSPSSVRCSGRGLALMSSAVDELNFDRNGAEVTLVKKITKNSKN